MDTNKYALFADVATTKNFTKSGDRLGYTQPGVSHILKTLEAELGFPLFTRTKKGVVLTANAEAILPYVRRLLAVNEQLEQVIHSLNGVESGHLTIAVFASISRNWLPGIIHAFETRYPNVEIEIMEGGSDEIMGWLENSVADFGLLSRRSGAGMEWIPLYEDPLMAILPPDYPVEGDSFPIAEMADKPFILSAMGVDYDIHHALSDAGIRPRIHLSCKDDYSIVAMVANQLGVSILPDLVIDGVRGRIKALPLEPRYTRQLGICYRSAAGLSPAAKRFLEVAQEELRAIRNS